tara:strand:- start:51 stop:473 length:423 start_codon:yes stop_codon:yes gene_type:complete
VIEIVIRHSLLPKQLSKNNNQLPTEKETDNMKAKFKDIQQAYLDKNVFYGLTNLNDGFDAKSIKYFSETDFKIVLDRVKKLGIGIAGIEPWKDGEFYDVVVYELITDNPANPEWYLKAFEDFKKVEKNLQYSATFLVLEK